VVCRSTTRYVGTASSDSVVLAWFSIATAIPPNQRAHWWRSHRRTDHLGPRECCRVGAGLLCCKKVSRLGFTTRLCSSCLTPVTCSTRIYTSAAQIATRNALLRAFNANRTVKRSEFVTSNTCIFSPAETKQLFETLAVYQPDTRDWEFKYPTDARYCQMSNHASENKTQVDLTANPISVNSQFSICPTHSPLSLSLSLSLSLGTYQSIDSLIYVAIWHRRVVVLRVPVALVTLLQLHNKHQL
jgi:hypothetical protein